MASSAKYITRKSKTEHKDNIGIAISATSSNTASITLSTKASSCCGRIIKKPSNLVLRQDFQIRNKYLQKLGVASPPSTRAPAKGSSSRLHANRQDHHKQSNILRKFEYISPLHVGSLEEYPDPNRKRSVSFDSCVRIRVIHNKNRDSRCIKNSLWYTPDEEERNIQRNEFEFKAENRDWRRVVDDEQFVTCPKTGEKVHPAHVHWLDHITARSWQHPLQRRIGR